jgi:hypothetical protein
MIWRSCAETRLESAFTQPFRENGFESRGIANKSPLNKRLEQSEERRSCSTAGRQALNIMVNSGQSKIVYQLSGIHTERRLCTVLVAE